MLLHLQLQVQVQHVIRCVDLDAKIDMGRVIDVPHMLIQLVRCAQEAIS